MDKARRHELKMLKYKKRIINRRLTKVVGNLYAFRSHGAPCSCFMCSPKKANGEKKKEYQEIKFQMTA